MNMKYTLALFLTAAFFMSGCSSNDTSDAGNGTGYYDNMDNAYYGPNNDTTGIYGTGSYRTGDYGTQTSGTNGYNAGYNGNAGVNANGTGTTNGAGGMASSSTTGTNY